MSYDNDLPVAPNDVEYCHYCLSEILADEVVRYNDLPYCPGCMSEAAPYCHICKHAPCSCSSDFERFILGTYRSINAVYMAGTKGGQ